MIQKPDFNGAAFSPCRTYRYALWRYVGEPHQTHLGNFCMFVGLNPSTADEKKNDPTIRRCMAFAKAWGHTALVMCNLFAFRATDPRDLLLQREPVGPENDHYLATLAKGASIIVAAWGAHARHYPTRVRTVRALLPELHHLQLTREGHPGHPLYLSQHLDDGTLRTPKPWVRT